jgi:hypothetical protein
VYGPRLPKKQIGGPSAIHSKATFTGSRPSSSPATANTLSLAVILRLSDAGAVLESFDQPLHLRYVYSLILHASNFFGRKLLRNLVVIHQAGICHGDFVPRNTAKNSLIPDFSHADPNHTCPGVDTCPELIQARLDLGLERDTGHSLVWIMFVLSCLVVYVASRMYS